ncbi:MAG: carboxypeptidase regulatory-like domain-containing protein [Armatimonadetes bacterium]|nr:carboxypeptidase regulatory-like domain-containing protein [Armatimonadota bacterium]
MRVRRSSLGWSVLLLVSLVTAVAAKTSHEFVGAQGPAFMRAQLRQAGSRQVAPTADHNITQSASDNIDPVWSPDGTRVAFASNRAGSYDIYIARSDGSNPDTGALLTPKLISGVAGDERYPAWNPGGLDLAYVRGNAIYVRNLRTMAEIQLIDQLTNIQGLTYSPDGSRLVFSARLAGDSDLNLYWVTTDPQSTDPATGKPQMVQITNAAGNEVQPSWFPNSDAADGRQVIFSSNANGDYDLYRVTPPTVGGAPVALTAANRVLGNGGDGDQSYPSWVRPGGSRDASYDQPYYLLYADNGNGNYDLRVVDADLVPASAVVYQGAGDQIQPVACPIQDTTHNACVYSGKKTGITTNQLFVIDIFDNSAPILGDGITTSLPSVSPQRGFPGSTVTITAKVYDKGSGVAPAPIDYDGDTIPDSGVWAIVRVADRPVFARWTTGSTEVQPNHISNTVWAHVSNNQIETDQEIVDIPTTRLSGNLTTVQPNDPTELGAAITGPGVAYRFTTLDAMSFVNRVGLPLRDDGTQGDAVAGDGIYTGTWLTPAESHDYYVDVVPVDTRGNAPVDPDLGMDGLGRTNPLETTYRYPDGIATCMGPWAIGYDHVAGFTTRQLDITRKILLVSDYGCGQKFQAADFATTASAALSRYWPVALPTEHYWFTDDDVAGAESMTAAPVITFGSGVSGVQRTIGPNPTVSAGTQVPDGPWSCGPFAQLNGGGQPFGGPQDVDQVAIWRVLCRGPLDAGTLNAYTPAPLAAVEGSPVPAQNGDHMVVFSSPYTGDVYAQPGTLLDASTQALLRSFVAAGGRLVVSGMDIAWALTKNGTQASPFLQDVLKATFISDATPGAVNSPISGYDSGRTRMTPPDAQGGVEPQLFQFGGSPVAASMTGRPMNADGGVPGNLALLRINGGGDTQGGWPFSGDGCPNAFFIDNVSPTGGGLSTFDYAGGDGSAAVRYIDPTTGSRVVYFAFGLESLRADFILHDHNPAPYVVHGMEHRVRLMTNLSDYLRTGGLRGKVVDTDSLTPMAGITVIARRGTGTNGTIMGRTTTLSDGTYLLEGLTVGDYALFVQSAEYTADHRPVQRVYGGQVSQNSDLTMRLLRFETSALYGTVTGPTGTPVSGATVIASLATAGANPMQVSTTTDTVGQYSLSVPSGTYTLTASAAGFASATRTDIIVVAGADQKQDLQLTASPGVLTGTITGNGAGVGGATVVATSGGVTVGSTTTAADGTYTMSIAAGTYDLVVTAPGYQQGRKAAVVVTSSATTTANLALTAVAPGSIAGLITVQGSNQAVGGVTVSLLAGGATVRSTTSASTTTTQGGVTYNWKIDDVPAGLYDVRVQAPGYNAQTTTSVTVTSNQLTSGIDFTLQPLHVFISSLSMASTPFDYSTSAPDAQTLIDDDNNAATPLKMAAYNTATAAYAYYPNAPGRTFTLGRGYFLKLANNAALTREGVRAATTGSGYDVPLLNGWNLIGAVYEFPVDLFSCQVILEVNGAGSTVYSFQEAVARGLVGGSMYTLNFGVYQQVYRFDPYTGYWLRGYVPSAATTLKLRVPPTPLGGSSNRGRSAATPTDWKASIVAKTTDGVASQATFGVGGNSATVYDGADRAQPPAPPVAAQWLELGFPHADWGRYSGSYQSDIRSASRSLRWELELKGAKPGQMVSLSWPELGANIPGNLRVILEDLQTGVRRSLRHTSGYTVRADGSARRLAIIVEPADNRPAVTSLAYTASRAVGGQVHFTLTADLTTNVVVRGLNGALVKTLLRDEVLTAGPQVVVWDGTDDSGRVAPDGTYRLEVVAVGDTGEQVRATTTVRQQR